MTAEITPTQNGATALNNNQLWAEVLCCGVCAQIFASTPATREPVNLACGHVMCRQCLAQLKPRQCVIGQCQHPITSLCLPTNQCLLRVLHDERDVDNVNLELGVPIDSLPIYRQCMKNMMDLASYLHRAQSEKGASVWSAELSRVSVRKLVSLLCLQLVERDGRQACIRMARSFADRLLSEMLLQLQQNTNHSSQLWTAVRTRGCQFLGPAMQEEVLRLTLLALSDGTLISRKNLVMYIVQTLEKDYPHASKTCVGHVVQLLYRASCFNVFKRDGESSLMQLKQEYRNYEPLRREHDTQIVQIATESGLRLSADQWSSLLYADQTHRTHMQGIIDKLVTPHSITEGINEFLVSMQRIGDPDRMLDIVPDLQLFASMSPPGVHGNGAGSDSSPSDWATTERAIGACRRVLDAQVKLSKKKRFSHHNRATIVAAQSLPLPVEPPSTPTTAVSNSSPAATLSPVPVPSSGSQMRANRNLIATQSNPSVGVTKYKTTMCRDFLMRNSCPRGEQCTFAHSVAERQHYRANNNVIDTATVGGSGSVNVGLAAAVARADAMPIQQSFVAIHGTHANVVQNATPPQFAVPSGAALPVLTPTAVIGATPAMLLNSAANGGLVRQPILLPPPATAPPPPTVQKFRQIIINPASHNCSSPSTLSATRLQQVVPTQTIMSPQRSINVDAPSPVNSTQLNMKRDEILTRLAELQTLQSVSNYVPTSDDVAHVSYAVAISVLGDAPKEKSRLKQDGEFYTPWTSRAMVPEWKIYAIDAELDTRQQQTSEWNHDTTMISTNSSDNPLWLHSIEATTMDMLNQICSASNASDAGTSQLAGVEQSMQPTALDRVSNDSVAKSVSIHNTAVGQMPTDARRSDFPALLSSVRTARAPPVRVCSSMPTSVQAKSATTVVSVKDMITQPIATPSVVAHKPGPVASIDAVVPSVYELPKVMRGDAGMMFRPAAEDVPMQLEKIMQCKESINAGNATRAPPCAVEKQQLRYELGIINKQLQTLDIETEQECLLMELKTVNQNLDRLEKQDAARQSVD